MFTERYGLRPYIKQMRLVFKGLSNYPYRVFRFKQKECLLSCAQKEGMVALVCILEKSATSFFRALFIKINDCHNYLNYTCLFFGIKSDYLKLQHITIRLVG